MWGPVDLPDRRVLQQEVMSSLLFLPVRNCWLCVSPGDSAAGRQTVEKVFNDFYPAEVGKPDIWDI